MKLLERFDKYWSSAGDAISELHSQGMFTQSVILTYVYIDHMSWLSVDHYKQTPDDFKAWVDEYMISKNPIGCSSNDLWEARNALIHMGTSESSNYKQRNAKKLHYYTKAKLNEEFLAAETLYIDLDHLIGSFLTGVLFFRTSIENHPQRSEIVEDKLGKLMFSFVKEV